MKKKLVFLLPVCLFFLSELSLRVLNVHQDIWHKELVRYLEKGSQLDVLFIGSSRVAAAIDAKLFEEKTGLKSYNLGTGLSTLHQHYFLLRKIYQNQPERLKNLTVMLEAPFGLPGYYYWDKGWFEKEHPGYLVDLMTLGDLIPFLTSETPLEDKLGLTFRFLFKWSSLMTHKEEGRSLLLKSWNSLLKDFFISVGLFKSSSSLGVKFVDAGGIRSDESGIRKVRELAKISARERIKRQKIFNYWCHSLVQSIYELLKEKGGRLVLYNIPISPIQREEYKTVIMKKNIDIFKKEYLDTKKIPFLDTKNEWSHESFPDLWHLGLFKRTEYTFALIEEFSKK